MRRHNTGLASIELAIALIFFIVLMIVLSVLFNDDAGVMGWVQGLFR